MNILPQLLKPDFLLTKIFLYYIGHQTINNKQALSIGKKLCTSNVVHIGVVAYCTGQGWVHMVLCVMQGNVTVWKPADTAVLSNYIVFQILKEAGLPDGTCSAAQDVQDSIKVDFLVHTKYTDVFSLSYYELTQQLFCIYVRMVW